MITIYLIKCSLIWALSLLIYLLLFRDKNLFRTNRTFLIGSLLAGLLIPIIQQMEWLTVASNSPISQVITTQENLIELPRLAASVIQEPIINNTDSNSFQSLLFLIYLLGIIITSLRFINGLWAIRKIHLVGDSQSFSGLQLIVHNLEKLPFSFFNAVYLNRKLLEDSYLSTILNHERAHISGRHSLDIMLLEILKIIFWFHPLVYFYKKLIKEVHEFIADAQASGTNKVSYCRQLMTPESPLISVALGNNFFGNNLKKRILMINNNNKNYLVYLTTLPSLCICLLLWSCNTTDDSENFDSYKVGADVEFEIQQSYLRLGQSKTLNSIYNKLVKKHPEHKSYIQNRLTQHLNHLGAELTFSESESSNCITISGIDDMDAYLVSPYPNLRPISESDLKKTTMANYRTDPTTGDIIPLRGCEYVTNAGSQVYCSGDGLVVEVNKNTEDFGNTVTVEHGHNMKTFYAHMDEIHIREGQFIEKASILGTVGTSGSISDPYLHWEIIRKDYRTSLGGIQQYSVQTIN